MLGVPYDRRVVDKCYRDCAHCSCHSDFAGFTSAVVRGDIGKSIMIEGGEAYFGQIRCYKENPMENSGYVVL